MQTRGAASCLHGAPAGVPHTSASFPCEMQNPSGPRQPEPPLQPQPLHWQASAATTVDGAGNIKNPNEIRYKTTCDHAAHGLLPFVERDQCTRFVLRREEGFEKGSRLFDEAVHDLLLAGLVEIDRELVAVDLGHAAIAEFLVEHAHADAEPRALGRARSDERAF